jgi:exodeoxyribonuclease V alpha subunit
MAEAEKTYKVNVQIKRVLYPKVETEKTFTIFSGQIFDHEEKKKNGTLITCKGHLKPVMQGMRLTLTGHAEYDKDRGEWQLIFKHAHVVSTQTREGMVAYLTQEGPNVGETRAEELVDAFGSDDKLIEILAAQPEVVAAKIKGMTPNRAQELSQWAKGEKENAVFKKELYGLQLSHYLVTKLFAKYGKDTPTVVRTDPFRLTNEVDGIGFKTASRIADAVGINGADPRRVRAGVLFTLGELHDHHGHTCIAWDMLVTKSMETLAVTQEKVIEAIKELLKEGELLRQDADPREYSEYPELFDEVEKCLAPTTP